MLYRGVRWYGTRCLGEVRGRYGAQGTGVQGKYGAGTGQVRGRYSAQGTLGTTRGRAWYMPGVRSKVHWVHFRGMLGTFQG